MLESLVIEVNALSAYDALDLPLYIGFEFYEVCTKITVKVIISETIDINVLVLIGYKP